MSYIKHRTFNTILYYTKQKMTFLIKSNCVDCITFNVASYGDAAGYAVLKFSWLIVETQILALTLHIRM